MLKIQVLGKGLIPRGYGIAPRLEPFPADLTLIGTILTCSNLKVNYINPETNKPMPLTRENCQKVYKKYENVVSDKPKKTTIDNVKPSVPTPPPASVSDYNKKNDDLVITPIVKDDKSNKNTEPKSSDVPKNNQHDHNKNNSKYNDRNK